MFVTFEHICFCLLRFSHLINCYRIIVYFLWIIFKNIKADIWKKWRMCVEYRSLARKIFSTPPPPTHPTPPPKNLQLFLKIVLIVFHIPDFSKTKTSQFCTPTMQVGCKGYVGVEWLGQKSSEYWVIAKICILITRSW